MVRIDFNLVSKERESKEGVMSLDEGGNADPVSQADEVMSNKVQCVHVD
jgi:hypothetical protein